MKEESIRQEKELEDALDEAEAMEVSVPEQGAGAELSEEEKDNDLGFGHSISRDNARLINPDGSFNVRKINVGLRAINPYLYLVSLPWWKFNLLVIGAFTLFNALFALIYMAAGIENLGASVEMSWLDKFATGFYFSVQTFTTVGYGAISPIGHLTNLIASFEALIGLLAFALATGLLFGRFAQPSAKIQFSPQMVMAPYGEINGLMFRIVNRRSNQLIDLSIKIVLMMYEEEDGVDKMKFHNLELERNHVNLFPSTWTIVHPVDKKESPIYGLNKETLDMRNAEFLIILSGYDDTFAQMVHQRSSYKCSDIIWGAKFVRAFHTDEDGKSVVDIDKVGICEFAQLNEY
ncbi:MAG: ion channel [Bacteroidia bacterium]